MNKTERIECIINALCDGNKSKFARVLGVKPQTINTWLTRDTFDIERVYSCCTQLSPHWLLTGEGEMLKNSTTQTSSGDNSPNISGNGNHVNNAATIDKALNEIAEQRRLVSKSQEQIDRLLGIIEQMTKIKE